MLTQALAPYEVRFTMPDITDEYAQIQFCFGTENVTTVIDNVQMLRLTNTSMRMNPLNNGDFSAGQSGWTPINDSGGYAAATFNQKAVFDITSIGANPWSVMLMQDKLPMYTGVTYTLEFDAASTVARNAEVVFENNQNNQYVRSFDKIMTLTTDTAHYSYNFTITQDQPLALKFLLGNMDNIDPLPADITKIPTQLSTITISNVKLYISAPPIM